MSRYRKVAVQIWGDQHFLSFTDDGKLAFLFLLTHPNMTSIGAMRATIPGLAAELGWKEEAFRKALAQPLRKGMVKADEKAFLVTLPNFIRHNPPESPNVVKSWAAVISTLPECALLVQHLCVVKAFTEGLGKAFTEALPKDFRKGMPNPDPDPEQDPEPEYTSPNGDVCPETPEASSAPPPTPAPVPPDPKRQTLDAPPPVLVFPCDGKPEFYELTEEKLREYEDTYRTINVLDCLRDALQWLRDDPKRKKTNGGMPKFLGNWLRRSVNKGEHKKTAGNNGATATAKGPTETDPFLAMCRMLAVKHPGKTKPDIGNMAEANVFALREKKWPDKKIIQWAEEQAQKYRAGQASNRPPVPNTAAAVNDTGINAALQAAINAAAPVGELKRASELIHDMEGAPK